MDKSDNGKPRSSASARRSPSVPNVAGTFDAAVERAYEDLPLSPERLHELADDLVVRGEEAAEDIARFVERHPGRALAMSFLAGLTVGVLLISRRSTE